jgi:hypothetical protein
MTNVKPNPIFRLMPSLTDVAFLMPLVFLFTRMEGVRTMLGDGDTGWHIRTGEWILAHHRVPHEDLFSYTMPGKAWFAWEWLWDFGAGWLHQQWGLGGVVLASMFVICLTCALLFRVVNRRCGNPLVAIGFTVFAAATSTIHWLARPHLFTMLFTVVFLVVLERVREGRTKLLWWLPAITILWTNLHGGFFVGIVILGAYAGGELVRALVAAEREERSEALRASVPYLAAAAGCLAASLVNPYFYQLHLHILKYFRDPFVLRNIAEFQGANFQDSGSVYFEAMLVLSVGAAAWHGIHKRFTDVLLVLGWGHLSLLSARNIPLFAMITAPIAAAAVAECLEAFRRAPVAQWLRQAVGVVESTGAEIQPIDRLWRVHAVCAAALLVIGLGMASRGAGKLLKPEYDPKSYPAGALALLQPSQRIFTSDQWGDYLIYHLSPAGIKVYFDGRSDFYGGKFCQEYMDVVGVKYNWEQTLARYGVDTVLLSPDAALASTIKESNHWRVAYDDGKSIVFRAAGAPAGRAERTSTSTTGGRGRDLTITYSNQSVHREDHVSQPIGESPL